MIERSLAHDAQPSTPKPTLDYVWRGRGLFETYRDEILAGYQGGGRWLVPSGTESGSLYEVRAGIRPERNRCECRGFASHGHCSHLVAAQRVARRSGVCDACGERRWWSQLTEVQEEDELLAWFPGDVLCSICIPGHWT